MRIAIYILTLVLICSIGRSTAQTTELYGGLSYSKYKWKPTYLNIDKSDYQPGFQAGIMWGPKEKNLIGIRRFIEPLIAVEYNYFQAKVPIVRVDGRYDLTQVEAHAARVAIPVRLRIKRFADKHVELFAVAEPGANLVFLQNYPELNTDVDMLNTVDFSMNVGLGTTIRFMPEKGEKSGYKFSGISVSALKNLEMGASAGDHMMVGNLDQFRFNIGVRFSYLKAKRRFRLFNREKKD